MTLNKFIILSPIQNEKKIDFNHEKKTGSQREVQQYNSWIKGDACCCLFHSDMNFLIDGFKNGEIKYEGPNENKGQLNCMQSI